MPECVELPVSLEESGESLILNVLPADAIRAQNDSAYLLQLVNTEQERNRQPCVSMTVRRKADQESEGWYPTFDQNFMSSYEEHGGVNGPKDIIKKVTLSMQQKGYDIGWQQSQEYLKKLKRDYKCVVNNTIPGIRSMGRVNLAQLQRIFGKNSEAQPEAGPSLPLSSSSVHEELKIPEKTKLEDIMKKYSAVMEVCISSRKEWKMNKQKRHKIKIKKIEEIMAQKKRQREEKLKVMKALLEAISKNE